MHQPRHRPAYVTQPLRPLRGTRQRLKHGSRPHPAATHSPATGKPGHDLRRHTGHHSRSTAIAATRRISIKATLPDMPSTTKPRAAAAPAAAPAQPACPSRAQCFHSCVPHTSSEQHHGDLPAGGSKRSREKQPGTAPCLTSLRPAARPGCVALTSARHHQAVKQTTSRGPCGAPISRLRQVSGEPSSVERSRALVAGRTTCPVAPAMPVSASLPLAPLRRPEWLAGNRRASSAALARFHGPTPEERARPHERSALPILDDAPPSASRPASPGRLRRPLAPSLPPACFRAGERPSSPLPLAEPCHLHLSTTCVATAGQP